MRMICFADIDNNLMAHTKKLPAHLPLTDGSVDKSGKVSSSLTPWQAQLVQLLQNPQAPTLAMADLMALPDLPIRGAARAQAGSQA